MKRKLTIFLAVAVLTVSGTYAVAQQHMRMSHPMGGEQGPAAHAQLIATFLSLNDSQKVVFNAAMQDLDATQQSLAAKHHDLDKQLHDLLATGTTDAAAVGSLVLQQRAIGEQMKAAHDTFEQKVMTVLNADQKARAEALHAAMQIFHVGPPEGGARRE
jgi:Spy/CpxP family protein refolding chaperone